MRKTLRMSILAISLGVGLWMSPVGVIVIGFWDVVKSGHSEKSLLSRSNLEDIAQSCIPLLLKTNSMRVYTGNDADLPMVIRNLNAKTIKCTQWEVEIELHGGFNHFGYRFIPNYSADKSALLWFTEKSSKPLLELPKVLLSRSDEELSLNSAINSSNCNVSE